MQNSTPDVLEQVPAGGGMNKPASGTYGERAELAQLEAQLPTSSAPAQPAPSPTPSPAPGLASAPTQPAGLPRGLTSPTRQPDTPIASPLTGPPDPFAGAVDARQRRLQWVTLLAEHGSSPEVREFASVLKAKLSGV